MGSRFDSRPRGSRFDDDFEVASIQGGLESQQENVGVTVQWYRFDPENSTWDETYSEGTRIYHDPIEMPLLSIVRSPGSDMPMPEGFYTTDTLEARASYDIVRRAGLWELDLRTDAYLLDRFTYDQSVWKPTNISMEEGQVHERRVAVTISANEVDPAELVFEPQFRAYSQ